MKKIKFLKLLLAVFLIIPSYAISYDELGDPRPDDQLMHAIKMGLPQMVEISLKAGADANVVYDKNFGITPLVQMVKYFEFIKVQGRDPMKILKTLFKAGADPNLVVTPDVMTFGQSNPMFAAARAGSLDILSAMFAQGGDKNLRVESGHSYGKIGLFAAGMPDDAKSLEGTQIIDDLIAIGLDPTEGGTYKAYYTCKLNRWCIKKLVSVGFDLAFVVEKLDICKKLPERICRELRDIDGMIYRD